VLTHDVDQLYDRELFRVLGDGNHLLRTLFAGEQGNPTACLGRILRSLFSPRRVGVDIGRIRVLERLYGFRSTFFFLMDRFRFDRNGGRYRVEDPRLTSLINELAEEGCEIGVHGGFFDFDSVEYLKSSRERLEVVAGVEISGIRNHQLQFSGLPTWRAQENAGYEYDATFGLNERIGPLGGIALPFFAVDAEAGGRRVDVLELPLTIMDTTLFRWIGLDAAGAAALVEEHVQWLARTGGLGVFLWHNNYFAEEEYREWEETYEVLLSALTRERAWVATAMEISNWWRESSDVAIIRTVSNPGEDSFDGFVEARRDLAPFELAIASVGGRRQVRIEGSGAEVEERGKEVIVRHAHMAAGERLRIQVGLPGVRES